ncbi:hypothetical protein BGW36DRAFT_287068 [Talaromyces proteolyticus]|uniref:Uncharacterized protein n=1 Tax=Talaromyces proteolyticus TaxID=1131652 RepID=A0AAD4Q586_9EURO|nr:uncharacterized protein BGW36DRAFT_287068 [Talaromyces proteolyticus]KAH8704016.1 hypothetical protein BGW36DRAFT_287068 [Talaromyces proteolyticus]
MGTRSLICIFYKGRFMVAQYTQFDGYLEGQGWSILKFLVVHGNIDRLKAGMEFVSIIDRERLTQLVSGHGYTTSDHSGQMVCECGAPQPFSGPGTCVPPSLSRMTGANILNMIASASDQSYLPVTLGLEFVNDGLFCEFAYCVDLDADVFEIFAGCVEKPKKTSSNDTSKEELLIGQCRFLEVGAETDTVPKLLMSYPFDHLPGNLNDMVNQVTTKNPDMFIKDDEDEPKSPTKKDEEDEKSGEVKDSEEKHDETETTS